MENPIVLEYYGIIVERMRADGLLGESGNPLLQSEDTFCRYCEQIIQDSELETLRVEVMNLEKLTHRYQERFNIVGSVHKVFFEETPHGKTYKYLHIEQLLLEFHHTPMRFMDWLLERYCYMQFSDAIPAYIEYLRINGLETCYKSLVQNLCCRFYSK